MSETYDLQQAFRAFKMIESIRQANTSTPKIEFKENWVDIFSVSMLLAFVNSNRIYPKFCFKNEDVRNFLLRMGINRYGTVNYKDDRQYHDSYGRFIEFINFSSQEEVDNYLQEVFGILKQTNLKEEDINAIVYISQELMDNVIRHANSPNGGLLCGMVYPKKKKVEFSIVDCGIGFKGSLRRRKEFENISDLEAMRIATLKENMDGTCDIKKGGGNGIPYSWKLVDKARGELIIFSGNAIFYNGYISELTHKWQGVAIRFSFPLNTLSREMIIDIFGYEDIGFPEEEEFLF